MTKRADRPPLAIEDIAAATLTGDVRDFMMQWARNLPKPWAKMSEREQHDFVNAAGRQAESLVRKVTGLVGSQAFRNFEVSVGDFSKKGNRIEAKISAPYSRENIVEMAEAGEAGPIVLSLVSAEQFRGERAPASVMPDQPDLMDDDEAGADEPDAPQESDGGATAEPELVDAAAEKQDVPLHDPETGEIIEVSPEENQRQGEQKLLTYEQPGDELATAHQDDALSQAEVEALSPDQRANYEKLSGIKPVAPAADQQASDDADKPKRRGRKTAEQRTADNAASAGDRIL